MGAWQIPTSSFEVACGVHEILQQTTVYRLIRRKERGVILEKLAGLHGSDKARYIERLGDVAKIRDETRGTALKERPAFRSPRRHLHGAVNFDVIRRDKYEQRNKSLVPSKALTLTLLVRGEMCGLAKVGSRAPVHTQDATKIQFAPCLPQVVRIRKQLPPFLNLAIFREKPGAR